MQCGNGSVFYCEALGAALLQNQKDGIFASEGACRVLDLLGEDGFRRLVHRLFEEKSGAMTIGSIANLLSCETAKAQNYLETLTAWGILRVSTLDLGEETVTVFQENHFARNKLFMLQVIDAYAREISIPQNHMYCWAG